MLLAVCQEFNIENEIIPKIATCFGGGIGNTGDVCGAVTGAVMAIGLIRKQSTSLEEWMETAAVAKTFCQRFSEEMGTIKCKELTKLDFSMEDGLEQMMNSEVAMMVCFPAVATAFQITMDLLKSEQ